VHNIWNYLFSFVFNFLNWLVNLLPNADPATISFISSQVTTFRGYLSSISWIFPVNELLLLLGVVITIELTLLISKVIKWVLVNISLGFIKQ